MSVRDYRFGSFGTQRLLLLCVSAALLSQDAVAQETPPDPSLGTHYQTPADVEALRLYEHGSPLTARTRAEEILRTNPDSFFANYIVGRVLYENEGAFARSMRFLERARHIYDARFGANPQPDRPSAYHNVLLQEMASVAGDLEQYEDQLRFLDAHDAAYDPDMIAEHAWPLMKLRHFDQARERARAAIATGIPAQRQLAMTSLVGVENEVHHRQETYDAGLAAAAGARAQFAAFDPNGGGVAPYIATDLTNAGIGAQLMLRNDEAERLYIEATQHLENTESNPWLALASLYLDGGRAPEAVAALREMQTWRMRTDIALQESTSGDADETIALVLLASGDAEQGLRFVTRALDRPGRVHGSEEAEQPRGRQALIRRALMRLDAELAAERASWSGVMPRVAVPLRLRQWPDTERAIAVLANDEHLDATVRTPLGGQLGVSIWLVGDLVDVLGAGIMAIALERARREDAPYPFMSPIFDALEAEIDYARGDDHDAVALARRAIEAIPNSNALLRARVSAIAGAAAMRLGDDAGAVAFFARTLTSDPGTVRRLGLAIPASFASSGGDPAARAATLLGRSPRFAHDDRGFAIRIQTAGTSTRACLRTPAGAELTCVEVAQLPGESTDHWAERIAESFHHDAFALRFGLVQADFRTLDGTPVTARDHAREQLRGLLDNVTHEP